MGHHGTSGGWRAVQDQLVIDATTHEGHRSRTWATFVAPVLSVYVLSRLVVFGALLDAYGGHWTITKFAGIWDGRYYLRVAEHGYPTTLAQKPPLAAFFPLYPLLVRAASPLLGGNWALTAVAVSVVTGAAACLAVGALARDRAGDETGVRAGWLMAVAPGAAFLSPAYAEGLAITLCALVLIMLDRRRWLAAGAIGALATAASPLALPIVAAAAWSAWRSRRAQAWKAPVLASLGFVTYCLYLWAHMGTPFGWFDAERAGWAGHHVDLLAPVSWFGKSPGISFVEAFCAVIAVAGLWAMRRARVPGTWWVFTLALLASIAFDGGLWLTPRLLLSAFPIVPAAAMAVRGERYRALLAVSAVVMLLALVAYTQKTTGFVYQP
jgi:hypothetical protein